MKLQNFKKKVKLILKLVRIILIKIFTKNKTNDSDLLFLESANQISKLYDNKIEEKHLYEIRKKLKKYNRLLFSFSCPFYFLKNRNKNYIETFIKLKDMVNAFFLEDNKHLNAILKLHKGYIKFEFKLYYVLAKRILKKLKTKLILLTCSYGPKYPFIVAARELEIEVIELQHGMINKTHQGYNIPKRLEKEYVLPNYLISYGNYEKYMLSKKSIWSKKQIIPLGCPRYDFLENYQPANNNLEISKIIPNSVNVLFWPTQTHDKVMSVNGENELNADEVFSSIKQSKNWQLLIKLHPRENQKKGKKFYKKYKEKYNLKRCTIMKYKKENTYDCIAVSDAVILKHSTVGKEALLMGKPIINLEMKNSWDLSQFKELKSALCVKKGGDLYNFLTKMNKEKYKNTFNKERQKYIKKHFVNLGKAGTKISEFIKKRLQKNRK